MSFIEEVAKDFHAVSGSGLGGGDGGGEVVDHGVAVFEERSVLSLVQEAQRRRALEEHAHDAVIERPRGSRARVG